MRLGVAAVLVGFAAPVAAQSAIPHEQIIRGAIDTYIQPSFDQFAASANALKASLETLCDAPSAEALEAGRDQFKSVVASFSRVEFVRAGPLGVGDRLERLLFWPDRKGIALKQVQAALATEDQTAARPETLRDKSVAMQGLGALEFLLFGTGGEDLGTTGGYRCAYARSIVTLVSDLAATLDAEWHDTSAGGTIAHLLSPQPTFDDYRTETEVQERLAATLVHGTEVIRDQRVSPILSEATGSPKPKSALFWRSNMTVASLAANFDGLHDFFLAARYPEAIGATNEWVANGAIFEFENAARAAATITDPMEQAVTKPEQLRALKYMAIITGSLDHLLGENLAAALGLSVGFSALDGD
jgi:uncharacterized protein